MQSRQEGICKRDLDYFQIKCNCRFAFLGSLTIVTASALNDRPVQFDSQQQKRSSSSVPVSTLAFIQTMHKFLYVKLMHIGG